MAEELLREFGYDPKLQPKVRTAVLNFSTWVGRYFRELSRW